MRIERVALGVQTATIPVADLHGDTPGKTLLVTGGVDGDEYAGIEAAYRLVERYREKRFTGRLIVIPIVNMFGFAAGMSQNPLDGKYPKSVGLGTANGSPSQRLMHWLMTTYALHADAWYDAHGGAITERLHPFVWSFETRVAEVDQLTSRILAQMDAETIVQERAGFGSKAKRLARSGCVYLMGESGERGERRVDAIDRHISWIESVMSALGMISGEVKKHRGASTFFLRNVEYVLAPSDGLWYPEIGDRMTLRAGELIGRSADVGGRALKSMRVKRGGRLLWWKECLSMRRGDVLCAVGRN